MSTSAIKIAQIAANDQGFFVLEESGVLWQIDLFWKQKKQIVLAQYTVVKKGTGKIHE